MAAFYSKDAFLPILETPNGTTLMRQFRHRIRAADALGALAASLPSWLFRSRI